MRSKLALFDLDGTLFDTKDVNYWAYREALEQFGLSIEYEYFCKYCNGRHYTDFLPPVVNNDSEVMAQVHELKIQNYEKHLGRAVPNYNLLNIARLLSEEYFTAVVTTASRKNCMQLLSQFDVVSLFDQVYTREDVVHGKPNPEGFLKAMKAFDIRPEDTIIFEDSDVGIQAGRASGAKLFVVCGYN